MKLGMAKAMLLNELEPKNLNFRATILSFPTKKKISFFGINIEGLWFYRMAKAKLLPELGPTNLVSGQFSNIFNQTEKFWHELARTPRGETDFPAFSSIFRNFIGTCPFSRE